MEITDDDQRDKKWQIPSFWKSLTASSSQNLQSRSEIHRQLNGVVSFNGRSSSAFSSAAGSLIHRRDPSDDLYFPYEPLKQKMSAFEINDSREPQIVFGPHESDLLRFSGPLLITNAAFSRSLCKLFSCRPDARTDLTSTVALGNSILKDFKCYRVISPQERANTEGQKNVFRQLEAILHIYILAMFSHDFDALKEIARLSFLSVDPSSADFTTIHVQNISYEVEACLPGLFNYALYCLDDVADIDGSLGSIKAKIAFFLYCNLSENWARDLYEKMTRSL